MALCLLPALAVGGDAGGMFWSISRDAQHAGYLLGTIHSEDPRVLEFSEAFLERLRGSDHFAMELVPDLPTLSRLAESMQLPADQDLVSLIGEPRFERTARLAGEYGIPRAQLSRLKPWAVMMTLSVPPPKTGLFMDFSLSLRASGNGVKVIGLETLDEQLAFLERMSLEQQLEMLDHALSESEQVEAVYDRMIGIYLEGDLEALVSETTAQLQQLGEETRAHFLAEGIDARNHRMLASLLAAMAEGTVFAAVGALHLPGDQGLVELLRAAGYTLDALPSPFASP